MKDILLVEDNPTDVLLVREALERSGLEVRLSTVQDGAELMPFLRREGAYAGAPRPDLILLDLNLPRRHGLDALGELKAAPAFADIPVLVLTVSSNHGERTQAYRLHASCFVTKPSNFPRLVKIVDAVKVLWA